MVAFICSATLDPSDQDFILQLYLEFKGLMYSTAQKYITSPQAVEDIVQDSIAKLINKVDILRNMERCILASYIVSTIKNTAINQLKVDQAQNLCHIDFSEEERMTIQNRSLSIDEILIIKEQRLRLSKIWMQLSIDDQVLLEGKYILGYSDMELAEQLHCKMSSVRMKLTRARRNAQKLLIELRKRGGVDDKT